MSKLIEFTKSFFMYIYLVYSSFIGIFCAAIGLLLIPFAVGIIAGGTFGYKHLEKRVATIKSQ